MSIKIYGLCEPETGEIRYVGQSIDPLRRLSNHSSTSASLGMRVWVESLRVRHAAPLLVILAEVDSAEAADAAEQVFVRQLARPRLLNAQLGGGGVERRPRRAPTHRRGPSVGQELLRAELGRRFLSGCQAAKLIGAPAGVFSRLLQGRRGPSLALGISLEEHFGVPVATWNQPPVTA